MLYYLDEDINITVTLTTVPTKDTIEKYIVYKSGVQVFVGSCFLPANKSTKTFYLNNIIEDNKYINNRESGIDFTLCDKVCYYEVIIGDSIGSNTIEVAEIYRYPRHTIGLVDYDIELTPTSPYPLLQGYSRDREEFALQPHLPYIKSKNFIFSLLYDYYSDEAFWFSVNQTNTLSGVIEEGHNIGNFTLYDLYGDATIDKDGILYLSIDSLPYLYPAAIIDYCPSPFYLIWEDRYGSSQSQPFLGTSKFSETVEKETLIKFNNQKRVYSTTATQKFNIFSQYIPFETVPYYESIYTSPYLVLYDSASDCSYDVILTSTDYTEVTFRNNGKQLYNISLELEVAKKQIIGC